MAADTLTHSPLEVAADLDGLTLFLHDLADSPLFEHRGDALRQLVRSAAAARDELTERHELDEIEVEKVMHARLFEESGLYAGDFRLDYAARDIALLAAKIDKLAEDVIGVRWSAKRQRWFLSDQFEGDETTPVDDDA